MLMKWEDLQPGDKLKLSPEMFNIISNDESWFNKEWLNYDYMTVEWVDFQDDCIWISFKESVSCWSITYDGKFSDSRPNYMFNVFEIMDLGE